MKDKNKLTDEQKKLIELLMDGCNCNECAKILGVNRKTVYAWRDKPEVQAELDKGRQAMKNTVEQTILVNIEPLTLRLLEIAQRSKSDKTSLEAIQYCINRLLGSPGSKHQLDINEPSKANKKADINWDELEQMMDDNDSNEDNVVELKTVK